MGLLQRQMKMDSWMGSTLAYSPPMKPSRLPLEKSLAVSKHHTWMPARRCTGVLSLSPRTQKPVEPERRFQPANGCGNCAGFQQGAYPLLVGGFRTTNIRSESTIVDKNLALSGEDSPSLGPLNLHVLHPPFQNLKHSCPQRTRK